MRECWACSPDLPTPHQTNLPSSSTTLMAVAMAESNPRAVSLSVDKRSIAAWRARASAAIMSTAKESVALVGLSALGEGEGEGEVRGEVASEEEEGVDELAK
jgi:hypothetical protein